MTTLVLYLTFVLFQLVFYVGANVVYAPAIDAWQDEPICRNHKISNQQTLTFSRKKMYACEDITDGKKWIEVRLRNKKLEKIIFKDLFEYNDFMWKWQELEKSE